tara:strand:+ start:1711 stop:2142 length:432 start_codon:yes stop_codon:yes gene_type:complete
MKRTETNLIQELLRAVEVLGVDKTTKVLMIATTSSLTLQDPRVDFVFNMVSNHFFQTIEELINSKKKSNLRFLALKFATYYLYEHFEISFNELQVLFKRDKSLLSRMNRELKSKMDNEDGTTKIKNKFDFLVTEFKLKNDYKK